jgi:DNA-binding XRE family transcriptional regulator
MRKSKIEPIYARMGKTIRTLREDRGMLQETLARRTGMKRTSIVNIEGGRQRMVFHRAVQIARVLKVGVQELV